MTDPSTQLEVGIEFAGHRIERLVAQGGMGVIYRATQLRPPRPVALKLVAPFLSGDDSLLDRFRRESELAASIDHPNVIPIYQTGEEEGLLFIAMRWVEGTDLRGLIDSCGRLEPARAAAIVAQIAGALDEAHVHGLVHRDVKPGNVLIAPQDHVYLTDFGLTRDRASDKRLTPTNRWIGTLNYVSPEQIQGLPASPRADIYALGCVLYEALTGQPPFERGTDFATLWAHMTDPPPRVDAGGTSVAPELDDVIARALDKDPERRFSTAGELGRAALAASAAHERGPPRIRVETSDPSRVKAEVATDEPVNVPLPAGLEATAKRRLFGRDDELEQLRDSLAAARSGSRRAVLIGGEAGIGKTSLAATLASEAHDGGAAVLYGRCDRDLPIPYRPFVEVLGHLVEHAPRDLIERHVSDYGGVLGRMLPQLGKRLAERGGAENMQGDTYLLFSAVAGLLSATSARRPLVVVLDDLHWVDAPSVPLVRSLLTAPAQMAVLLVATYRDTEVGENEPARELLLDLGREAAVTRLELAGLDEPAVIELTSAAAEQELDEQGIRLARALRNETDGNPFYMMELLRSLIQTKKVVRTDGRWSTSVEVSELVLPDSVIDTITRRVALLEKRTGGRASDVLSAAAVIGREIDPDFLAEVLEDDVLEVLDAARDTRLLSETPGGYSFSHALVAQALYERLPKAERRRLHRAVAEALERRWGTDPGAQAAELARHWLAAGQPDTAEKSLHYIRRAGDHALANFAPAEAERLYRLGLERHDQQPAGGERMRCELLIGLGAAQRQRGLAEFRTTLLDAARLAQRIDAPDLLVRAALTNTRGFVSETGEVDTERVAILRSALEHVDARDSSEHAALLSTLAAELTFSRDWRRRLELSDEALAIARRLGDPPTLSGVLSTRFMAIWTPETREERYANTIEEVNVVERAGMGLLARFWALHWRATACVEAGEIHEFDRRVAEEAEIAERIQQPTALWLAAYDQATQALIRGRLEDAESWAAEAGRIGMEGSQPEAQAFYGGQLVNIRFEQGRLMELEALIEQEATDKPGIPAFSAALALARAEAGLEQKARAAMAPYARDGFGGFPYDPNWLVGLSLFGEACGHLRDARMAEALERLIVPWDGHVAFNSATVWGSVSRHLGVLDGVLQRHDRAVTRLERASDAHEQMGAPIWLARTKLNLAGVLRDRNGRGDLDRAERLLNEARASAEELGCSMIAEQSRRMLEAAADPEAASTFPPDLRLPRAGD